MVLIKSRVYDGARTCEFQLNTSSELRAASTVTNAQLRIDNNGGGDKKCYHSLHDDGQHRTRVVVVRCGHASSAMTRQQRTSKGPPRDPVPRLQCLLNSHCCGDLLAAHYQRHRHRHCHCPYNILSAPSLTFYYLNDVPLIIVSNSGIKERHFLVSMRKIFTGDLDYDL